VKLTGRPVNGADAVVNEMRRKIRASLADPRGDISAEDVFARLRAFHEDQLKARNADQPKA
jgi:hypothetical protein